jgi:RNA polymerase-associated protein RTF1
MPEIERENILASRLEEMQKFKDSAQLNEMYKMAGMDDEPARKKSKSSLGTLISGKHTSVTKETTKVLSNLKNLRKAKDERAQRRVSPY